ncbi:MAG: zinc-dependent metalloprotease [Paludibacteraceae bacterium]|nr:zinc-dependent metalloprotease [Paludibacteraceae bacterium]
MKSLSKLISIFVIIFVLLCFVSLNVRAEVYSIELKDSITLSQETLERYNNLISQPEVIWNSVVSIDVNMLISSDTIQIGLDNENIEVSIVYKNEENNYRYMHYVSTDTNTDVYLSILDGHIEANIHALSGTYRMFSIEENILSIAKYEYNYIEEEPEYIEYLEELEEAPEFTDEIANVVPTSTPIIRVLFLYTNAALNLMNYYTTIPSLYEMQMRQIVYDYINYANESFNNSNINAHMQLAYLGSTNYIETSQSWSNTLNYFYQDNDGYIDEVHSLREKYSADICVLFLDKDDYCGEAKKIKASAQTAFCLVRPARGCNRKFTAVHEIGHLIGCRHNYAADVNLVPYAYGHGYYHYEEGSPSTSWRTMMSYENKCDNDDYKCKRILYWSNPNVNYSDGYAMGTSGIANNARVWNERASTVSAFRTKDNSIALTVYDNNTSSLYESYEATTNIVTGAGYEIQSGQTVDMAAASEIKLLPNTHIKYGSNFRASIRNNADDHIYPQFIKSLNTGNIDIIKVLKFSISPNPVHDILTVSSTETLKNIAIYNLSGQCVLQTKQTEINVSELHDGIYLLRAVTADGEPLQTKFIKQ